jgi:hypothetical protein
VHLCGLQVLILKRAQDDLKREEEAKLKAKENFLNGKVPKLNIEGLNMSKLHRTPWHALDLVHFERMLNC